LFFPGARAAVASIRRDRSGKRPRDGDRALFVKPADVGAGFHPVRKAAARGEAQRLSIKC